MSIPLVFHDAALPGASPDLLLGGKAVNLVRLRTIKQPVPPFYVVTTEAFRRALCASGVEDRIAAHLKELDASDPVALRAMAEQIRDWITEVTLPEDLVDAIRPVHDATVPEDDFVAVRSSGAGEDASGQSFAGMHDSFLFVCGIDDILSALKKVWASAYNERALVYRRSQGLSLSDISVAVVVQRMIHAQSSGVMFTCDPASGSIHHLVISSLWGIGEGLVNEGLDADMFTLDKQTLQIDARLAQKSEQMIFDPAGRLKRDTVAEDRQVESSLNDQQIREVAQAGLIIERHFGRPQDIEFCFDAQGQLFVLQSRPVVHVPEYGPAAGHHLVWDNSNIIESYSGTTTPMTFSFIRRAYTIVYHCFAEVMGISPKTVRANSSTFENMLGLFRGRVYYNLKNWYRLIRLFPGFQYNSRFMESMMGLKEPLELEDESPPPGRLRRWFVELPALIRLLLRSTWNFRRIRSAVQRFQANFNAHYDRWIRLDFDQMSPHELMDLYYEMEDRLLWNWKSPIINDFFVMIFYGTLKKLCQSWCRDPSGSLQNDLISGEGGVESAEPTKMLLRLAKQAQDDPALRHLIQEESLEALPQRIANDSRLAKFSRQMQRYLDLYGFRCMNELKLEEYSLRDRPHLVYQVIRNYLTLDNPTALDVEAMEAREQSIRREAEQRAFAALAESRGYLPRKTIFRWVMKNARLGVKQRENMRFARTQIYGLLRELLRALGKQFVAEGILDDREDVFYLTLDEVWDFVKGTAVTTDLRGMSQLRRHEFDAYRREDTPPPDDRFDTYGIPYHRNRYRNIMQTEEEPGEGTLRGIGCCPGVVTGRTKVVRNPTDDMSLSGEILVAGHTDPGWVPLYPAVSGILIERGSILSHSAVVAREMGIPTIVGITGLIRTIRSGQQVRMDGRAGTVLILDDEPVTDSIAD